MRASRGRLAVMVTAALTVSMAALLSRVPAAHAQEGVPYVAMIIPHHVDPELHDEFRDWIARFRALVERQIARGTLSQTDICAYRSWRVLGPDAAGLNQNFLFVFEPVIPIGNYNIAHYINQAPEEERGRLFQDFRRMTSYGGQIMYATPVDRAVDGVDLGEDCAF